MLPPWPNRVSARRRRALGIAAVALGAVLISLLAGVWVVEEEAPEYLRTVGEAWGILSVLGEEPNSDKLIYAIQNREMKGRRLAIEYLGEGGYGGALPVFETIVRDSSEPDDIRVAALENSLLISREHGLELARAMVDDPILSGAARTILEDEEALRNRPSRVKKLFNAVPR